MIIEKKIKRNLESIFGPYAVKSCVRASSKRDWRFQKVSKGHFKLWLKTSCLRF